MVDNDFFPRHSVPGASLSRRQVAQALDIPLEMAARHGIPPRSSAAELARLQSDPPPWLVQSRANRTGKRPVWVELQCEICGARETARPKKWWPAFDFVLCEDHDPASAPPPAPGWRRSLFDGVGSRFRGVLDTRDP